MVDRPPWFSTSPLRRNLELVDAVRKGRLGAIEAVRMMEDTGPLLAREVTDKPDIARAEYHAESEEELATLEWDIAQEPNQKPQRKPRLKTVLDQAKKAGATTVTTPEGFTYGLGSGTQAEPLMSDSPFEREAARLRRLKREGGA